MTRPTGPRSWTQAVVALAIVVHGSFLVSLHTRTLNPLFNDAYNRPGPGADFFAIYHAGRQIVSGGDPYVDDESPRVTPPFAPFRYPPGVAMTLGVAVQTLPPWTAYVGWIVLLEATLLACLLATRRLIATARHRDLLTAGWLAFTPLYLELWMGQFTLITAALVLFAYLAWRAGRPIAGAGLWATGVALKLFPLALVPMLLRRRRIGAVLAGAIALVLALAWFAWHPEAGRLFYRLNVSEVDLRSFHAGNFGLQAFVHDAIAITGPISADVWRWIAMASTLVVVTTATLAMTWRRDADERVSIAIALLLLPLVSKHVWEHHYVVVLPALTLLVAAWADRPERLGALAVVYLLLWLPSPLLLLQHGGPDWYPERAWTPTTRAVYHALKPMTVLALFAGCVRAQLTDRQRDS